MGWLSMCSLGGFDSPRAYLDDQFTYVREDHRLTVLKSTVVGKNVYYAACERVAVADGARIVFAVVCLVRYTPRARRLHLRVQGHGRDRRALREQVSGIDPQPADADRIPMGERMARTLPDGHCGTVYRHRQTAAARWSDHRLRCADHLYRRAIARSLHGHRRSRKACEIGRA